MGRGIAIAVGWSAWAPVAWSQEAPLSAVPASLDGDFSWRRVGLPGARVSDIAVVPAGTGVWAVILDNGEVWVTTDAGASFGRRLGAPTTEIDPRRRIEARIQELIDDLRAATQDVDPFSDSADDASIDALQRELGLLQDQLNELAQDDRATPEAERFAMPRVWASDDALYAGRADGLWRSEDLGASWRDVLDVPTHGLARAPGRSLWVAGTDDGMRFSLDGITWFDPEDGTEGLAVADLATGQDGVWAATADGAWFAPDGQSWARVGGAGQVLRVRPDPDWARGAWIATADGILRTDDGGATLREGLGAPIAGVTSLAWLGTGHLLAASADGVWESVDGGTTWSARARGLADADTRALAQDGTTLLLGGAQGLFRLVAGGPAVEGPARAPDVALQPLIEAATGREELIQRTGNRWASTFLPRFQVDFDWAQYSAVDWALLTGTSAASGTAWGVNAGFTWTPRSQTNLDDALLPIDAVWLVDDGPVAGAFTASTSRDAVRYRIAVSQQVADLYFARADLESTRATAGSVGEAVESALRIAEIDARLDSLTNGALTRLRQQNARENP